MIVIVYMVCYCTLFENVTFQNKNSDFCAPLTSFDWNEVDPNLLGTSSIDTTCTIWGLEVSYPDLGTSSIDITCTIWELEVSYPALIHNKVVPSEVCNARL